MKKIFDAAWRGWIAENVNAGRDRNGIFKILLDEGYAYDAIVQEMNFVPTLPLDQLVNPLRAQQAPGDNNYGAPLAADTLFIPNAEKIAAQGLDLYRLDHFLTADEAATLVGLIKQQLRPSTLASHEQDEAFRTSSSCNLSALDHPLIADVDARICKLIGIDPAYSEPIQGQHYGEGQQFKAHTDYFEAHELAAAGAQGQRTYTVMIYLNTVAEGGETVFSQVQQRFVPQTGCALIWNSLNADGSVNFQSLHQAMPVLRGEKLVITKWFRSKPRPDADPDTPMHTKEANELVPNYTRDGLLHTRLPQPLFAEVQAFYQRHRGQDKAEHIPGDFVYKANGGARSSSLVELSPELRQKIHDTLKPMMEQWCGKKLAPTYVYGIRVYHDQAVLKCHRDRLETHIISAIINVDQQVDADWPLAIDDNYYRRHQLILKPGDVVFYEGARLEHGRPTPLEGERFANIFCHFKPVDYVPRKVAGQ